MYYNYHFIIYILTAFVMNEKKFKMVKETCFAHWKRSGKNRVTFLCRTAFASFCVKIFYEYVILSETFSEKSWENWGLELIITFLL